MRIVLIFFVFVIQNNLYTFGQFSDSVEEVVTDDRIFSGSINDKYNITVYLKYYNPSDGHANIYSVKGWYYYNNVQKKIPLIGIYDGDLTLFVLKTQEKIDSISNFLYNGDSFWDKMEYLENISGFDEKFIIGLNKVNEWISGNKKLTLKLYSNDFQIKSRIEYLKIRINDNVKYVNLNDIAFYDSDFSLVNSIHNENDIRFLLKFDYQSRPYALGMCGAGSEIGYLILKYDGHLNFIESQRVLLESCEYGITNEELQVSDRNIKSYIITDNDSKSSKVSIDMKNVKIMTEK